MRVVLLKAENSCDFITSDNPVVLLNTFFSDTNAPWTHGIASRGLQIYFPISPRHAFFLYDNFFYDLYRAARLVVPVYPDDTRKLNALQYLNARQHIYWANDMRSALDRLHQEFFARRIEEQATLDVEVVEENQDTLRELSMLRRPRPSYNPRMRFVVAKRFATPIEGSFVRQLEWTTIVRDFSKGVRKGTIDPGENTDPFFEYAFKHPLIQFATASFERAGLMPHR